VIDRLLQRILRFSFRHRVFVLVCAAAVAAVCGVLAGRIRFDADVLNLLPRGGPAVGALQTYLREFGNVDRLFVMFDAPADRTIAEYRDEIDGLIARMRALPELGAVDAGDAAGTDWTYVLDRQLLMLEPDRMQEALARFQPDAMTQQLTNTRERLAMAPSALKPLVQQDPLDLLGLVRAQLTDQAIPLGLQPSPDGYVSPDGRARLVVAHPVAAPYDTAFSRRLDAALDALWANRPADAAASGLPPLVVKEAGGYRASVEAEDLIRSEGSLNGGLTLAAIVAIVAIVFRSLRPIVAVVIPMLLASFVTIVVDGALRPLSVVAAGSVAMLFGLGEDGGTLMYVSYMQQRRRGLDGEAASAGLSGIAISTTIGFATTAATFLGLAPIDFPALQELGVLIGAGILVSALFTIVLVPALVPRRPRQIELRRFEAHALARFVARYRTAILIAAAILTAGFGVAATRLRVVPSVDKLDAHTPARETERDIARRFNLPEDAVFVLAEGRDLEALLETNERLKTAVGLGIRASWPSDFLPSARHQQASSDQLRRAALDSAHARAALATASDRAGFRPDSFAPFLDRLDRLTDPAQRLTVSGYRDHGLDGVLGRYVQERDGMVRTVAYVSPRSSDELNRVVDVVRSVGGPITLTGVPIVNAELRDRFRSEFLKGGLIGTIGVAILLFVGFRRLAPTLLALAATGMGIVWSVGLLALAGVELDLFSVFAVLMSIGVGVDYAVHLLHRAQTDANQDVIATLAETGPAILIAASTTIIGFGSLVTSSYGPLRALGLVSSLAITGCVVTSLIVLPAWLARRS
jgi:predicted RND superfamily exporter protein